TEKEVWSRRRCEGLAIFLLLRRLPIAPPNKARRTSPGGLDQHRPDWLREAGIVEHHAQIGFFRIVRGLSPGRADLGGPGQDAKVRNSVAVAAIVGEDFHLAAQIERADRAGITVFNGSKRSNYRHDLVSSVRVMRPVGKAVTRCPCARSRAAASPDAL